MPDIATPDRVQGGAALRLHGPLHGLHLTAMPGRLRIQAAAELARLVLRGDPAALGAAYRLALPTQPCRVAEADGRTALWLGPDEWLLLAPPGTLEPAPVAGGAVVDVGHRQAGLLLDGPGAADALSAGCPLDLHISAFPPGMCTRTVFGKAEIVLWRQGGDRFHVEVWRSFAAYVLGLLDCAARAEQDPVAGPAQSYQFSAQKEL